MIFKAVDIEDVDKIRKWRNNSKQNMMLRTPFLLTREMQEDFYESKISNRNSNCRFWSIWKKENNLKSTLIGMAGLENIQWENRLAEISIITDPKHVFSLKDIVAKLIELAFNQLNLKSVFTEVYGCSPYRSIWKECADVFGAFESEIPFRKFYGGQYYNSIIYTFVLKEVTDGNSSSESPSELN